jgi:hypothetical protein
MEDYVKEKIKQNILTEINNLELPDNWTPKQVIDYITYKIDRK